jgi:hypothetical protein
MRSLDRLMTQAAVAVLVSAGMAASAAAQSQPPSGDTPGSNLTLSASVFGGYDSDITAASLGSAVQPSATLGGAIFTVNYRARTEKIGFATRTTADSRYYNADEPLKASTFSGLAVLGVQATPRLKLDASVSSMYSPQFAFSPLPISDTPEDLPPPTLDQGVSAYDIFTVTGNAAATARLTQRSSLSFTYGATQYRYVVDNSQTTSVSFGGGYSYNLTRYATFRLGYHEMNANYPTFLESSLRTFRQRSLDAGVNYSRPLSRSRRTTVSFGSGSSAIEHGQETFYTMTGNGGLQHQMGRTWRLSALYARGLGVVGGFAEPFFSDAVNANLRGNLHRRVRMIAMAGFANGDVGLGSRAQNFRSFQSSGRLEWAVHERVGVFGGYSYYQYTFQEGAGLPGVPSEFARHSVRAGMIFRLPIVQERTPRRAAR